MSLLSVPDGDSPWKQRCMERRGNPASNRLVQEVFSHPVSKWCPRRGRLEDMKQGGTFEYEKQDGGHELKEKEVGDDPDSQFQQQSGLVSQMQKESTWFLVVSDSINHLDNELVLLTGCDVVM
ncbi:hypothetical protein DY000_02030089 [Brassica cretica]|uniref:Uncharacterized protein n=1 Tax=Brassica cretica TaxID=69181 RepID=A0ABQ7DHK5_BRACR|nr:hypothetical protein DY000_02030089 [Brassica cretica]